MPERTAPIMKPIDTYKSNVKNNIIATIKYENKAYELKGEKNNPYILFDISDSVVTDNYECHTEDIEFENLNSVPQIIEQNSTECVEMGIDTDYFTFLEERI